MIYLRLFISFAYIGVFTFGGGYAMLPMFRRELSHRRQWVTDEEIADMFAAAQCLPGIIACNTAVFVGHKKRGVSGAITAALGVIFPSLTIITLIAAFFSSFSDNPYVISALAGVRVCVCVLILNAVIKLWKNAIVDKTSILIFSGIFITAVFTNINAAILIIVAGISGITISLLRKA